MRRYRRILFGGNVPKEEWGITMSVKSAFAHTLYQRRKELNLKQRDVSEAVEISDRHYQDLEMGKAEPRLTTAFRLAQALDFSLDEIKSAFRE